MSIALRVLQPAKALRPASTVLSTQTSVLLQPKNLNLNQAQARSMTSHEGNGQVPTWGFKERQPSSDEKALVDDVLKLYQLNPVTAAYARYDEKATFHDPIGLANGLNSVKAQFNGMPKIFSSSITKDIKFLENPEVKPPSVQFAQSQLYTLKAPKTDKLVNSLVTLHVDPSTNLIIKHEEQWDAEPNTTSSDGFFGAINEFRKKATAAMVEMGVSSKPADQQK